MGSCSCHPSPNPEELAQRFALEMCRKDQEIASLKRQLELVRLDLAKARR